MYDVVGAGRFERPTGRKRLRNRGSRGIWSTLYSQKKGRKRREGHTHTHTQYIYLVGLPPIDTKTGLAQCLGVV